MALSSTPLSEYPRPRLVRERYLCLNGSWLCGFSRGERPESWQEVLVPYPVGSALSGVTRVLQPGETLWYKRSFLLPEDYLGGRLLLHLDGVDEQARVYLNGMPAGEHQGAYSGFTLDITELCLAGENLLELQVTDSTGASGAGRGKQSLSPGGIWYSPMSGIWKTVWLEPVPRRYIQDISVLPLPEQGAVAVTVRSANPSPVRVVAAGQVGIGNANRPILIKLPQFRLWTPEDPALYPITAKLSYDTVTSYFAMRTLEVKKGTDGVARFYLNGQPRFVTGVLDQGVWPDSLYTPPDDGSMVRDIEMAKALGFDTLRKHAKTEPERWYYHCDRLGMMVWQDIPNGGSRYSPLLQYLPLAADLKIRDSAYRLFSRGSEQSRELYRQECREIVEQLDFYPSVVTWVLFNEGWGQFDALRAEELARELDPTRPVDHASGWYDQGGGDYRSRHVYFRPYRHRRDRLGRAVVLSEFGGYSLSEPGKKLFSYRRFENPAALLEGFRRLMQRQIAPAVKKGLAGMVYTQLTDVEKEKNGLVTAGRGEFKLPPEQVRGILRGIMPK